MVKHKSLVEERPDLVEEWDYEKNGDLLPMQVAFYSQKKVWWKCKEGHSWEASISNRTGKMHSNCPYCSGHKVLEGYNDLASVNPKLAETWDYEKNGDLKPTMVTCGSGKKVWWKCSKGHSWRATISDRNRGNGCPKCYVDNQTSFAEQAIYYFLDMLFHDEIKNRYKLKDDKGDIEADIYLSKQKIAIEYDGKYWHGNKQEKDC